MRDMQPHDEMDSSAEARPSGWRSAVRRIAASVRAVGQGQVFIRVTEATVNLQRHAEGAALLRRPQEQRVAQRFTLESNRFAAPVRARRILKSAAALLGSGSPNWRLAR